GGSRRGYDGDLTKDQFGHERWEPLVPSVCPAILDRRILAFDIASFPQALAERSHERRISVRRCAVEKSNHRDRLRLSARHERPPRRTTEQHEEFAPSHPDHGGAPPACRSTIEGDGSSSTASLLKSMAYRSHVDRIS